MKRVLCLLLMPTILLTQGAGFAHNHGGTAPAEHDRRPHFHTNSLSACPDHDHTHHHHGPGGHHHEEHEEDEVSWLDPLFTPQPEPLSEHDSDAVYIVDEALLVKRVSIAEDVTSAILWIVTGLTLFVRFWDSLANQSSLWSHPPPLISASDQPLYLRHLALLI